MAWERRGWHSSFGKTSKPDYSHSSQIFFSDKCHYNYICFGVTVASITIELPECMTLQLLFNSRYVKCNCIVSHIIKQLR
jgi:hypothetical protein